MFYLLKYRILALQFQFCSNSNNRSSMSRHREGMAVGTELCNKEFKILAPLEIVRII